MDLHFEKPEWCNDCVFGEESGCFCSLLNGELCYKHGDYEKHRPDWCPFDNDGKTITADGITLLKEQEAVIPKRMHNNERASFDNYLCECKNGLYYEQKYCDECGRSVKWE